MFICMVTKIKKLKFALYYSISVVCKGTKNLLFIRTYIY